MHIVRFFIYKLNNTVFQIIYYCKCRSAMIRTWSIDGWVCPDVKYTVLGGSNISAVLYNAQIQSIQTLNLLDYWLRILLPLANSLMCAESPQLSANAVQFSKLGHAQCSVTPVVFPGKRVQSHVGCFYN